MELAVRNGQIFVEPSAHWRVLLRRLDRRSAIARGIGNRAAWPVRLLE